MARLQAFRDRLPYVSQSALAAMLCIAKHEPLPDASTRTHIRSARDATVRQTTPYGPIHKVLTLPDTEGGTVDLEIQYPFAMLYHAATISKCFSHLILRTLAKYPASLSSPWRLVFYTDDVGPGNQLGYKHLRKFTAAYYSLLEFGAAALSDEEVWFELAVCRATVTSTLKDGDSGLIACLIHEGFFNEATHDMRTAGICLKLFDGQTVRLWVVFSMYLADADALRAAFGFKGHAGLKCCSICTNVYNLHYTGGRGIMERDPTGRAVLHTCTDVSKFELLTPATLLAIRQRLKDASRAMGRDEFEELKTRLGWNYLPSGVSFSRALRGIVDVCECLCFDWAHVYFVNGIFNAHVGMVFRELHKHHNIKYPVIADYISTWNWPRGVGSLSGKDVLADGAWKTMLEKASFTCSASEGRSLIPVMAHFAESVLLRADSERVRALGASLVLLGEVVHTLDRCSREDVDPAALSRVVVAQIHAFKGLFGEDVMVPKFHYALHLASFVRRWRVLPNALCLERKHRAPKRYADPAKNPDNHFENTVLRETTAHHLSALQLGEHFYDDPRVVHAAPPSAALGASMKSCFGVSFPCGPKVRVNAWETVSVSDVVLFRVPPYINVYI